MVWHDEFRVWKDVFPLLCIDKITLPHGIDSGIWLPDVALVTADSFYELSKSDRYPVRITREGDVDFSPGGFIRFSCKINLELFPFDSMTCLALVQSWFYTTAKQVFDKNESYITIYNFTEHEQWKLDSYDLDFTQTVNAKTGSSYSVVHFMINLSRKSGYYILNIVVPSTLMSTLEFITFSLPSNQTIRIEVSFICLLAYTMFQSIIQADLPKSADQTPLLSIYITLMIGYIAYAILMQCIVLTMTNKAAIGSDVPRLFLCCIRRSLIDDLQSTNMTSIASIAQSIGSKGSKLKEKRRNTNSKIWKYLYVRVDTLAAVIYFLLILGTSIAMLFVIPTLSDKNIDFFSD